MEHALNKEVLTIRVKSFHFQALFNGGNQTGLVLVDPVYSKYPNKLYQMSSVPHIVGGRYMFRVDDVVRKGGCSNLTAGTCNVSQQLMHIEQILCATNSFSFEFSID